MYWMLLSFGLCLKFVCLVMSEEPGSWSNLIFNSVLDILCKYQATDENVGWIFNNLIIWRRPHLLHNLPQTCDWWTRDILWWSSLSGQNNLDEIEIYWFCDYNRLNMIMKMKMQDLLIRLTHQPPDQVCLCFFYRKK